MIQKNFSNGVKNVLIGAEKKIQVLGYKELLPEDIFLEILEQAKGGIKEIFTLYGVDTKLTLEILERGIMNTDTKKRKGVYSGMHQRSKDILLSALKIAAGHSKSEATLEDLILALMTQDNWLSNFLEYIGINPADIETNLLDLTQMGVKDGLGKGKGQQIQGNSDSIEELFGNLADNI
ncbi:hypothetical protein LAT59_00710, partial [Candidatus Gracilibacteria bacterium]|nr:hypothetical protein [Candidatus Gracilibacteria bacterium]